MAASLPAAGRDVECGPIDEDHLERMTLGDPRLEREVLEIFMRQATLMLERMAGADRVFVAAAAHTLVGSARGIGAWCVARAAERLQRAAVAAGEKDLDEAIGELRAAAIEASAAIAARLSNDLSGRPHSH